jgi:hypothetical protein
MTTYWLNNELAAKSNAQIDGGNPVLSVIFSGRTERVYCPDSDEYRVTADVVEKAKELGATIIAYSESWSDTTYDAKQYAKQVGITVMPFAAFFAYLKRKGVTMRA